MIEGGPGPDTRLAAGQLLHNILKTRRSFSVCWAELDQLEDFAAADRAFVRAMSMAALRHAGRLAEGVGAHVRRPLDTLGPQVRVLLWLGAAQLWLLDTPAHAAVGETVAAAKRWPATRKAAGLVNAVLRRCAQDRAVFEAAPPERNWPDWLRSDFTASLGREGLEAIARAHQTAPLLHLTSTEPEETARALGGQEIAPGTVAVEMARVDQLPGYEAGRWWVQDMAAALAARLLNAQAGETVLDLCAAPGGKTLQLAARGARVVAVDRSRARLTALHENLTRTRLAGQVEVVQADLLSWRPEQRADAILLDAPCSALGTLRRHPEGAWIKRPEDLAGYRELQTQLLRRARDMLAPAGRMIYCVCTPRREEGRDLVDAVCSEGSLRRAPFDESELEGFPAARTAEGDALTIPWAEPYHDTFYLARLALA